MSREWLPIGSVSPSRNCCDLGDAAPGSGWGGDSRRQVAQGCPARALPGRLDHRDAEYLDSRAAVEPGEVALVVCAVFGWIARPNSLWPLLGVAALAVFPVGLALRGRTSPLVWTARLKRTASVASGILFGCAALVMWVVVLATGRGVAGTATTALIVLFYLVPDVALWIAGPLGEAPVTEIRRSGHPLPRPDCPDRGGNHGQLREDLNQMVCEASRGRDQEGGGQPCQLQQPSGAGTGG